VYKKSRHIYSFDDRVDDQQLEMVDMRHTCAQRAPRQLCHLREDREERRRRSVVHATAKRWVRKHIHVVSGGRLGNCNQSLRLHVAHEERACAHMPSSNASEGCGTAGKPPWRVSTDEMRCASSSAVSVPSPHKRKHCNALERKQSLRGQAVAARTLAMAKLTPANMASQRRSDALEVVRKRHAGIASASMLEADIGSEVLGTVPLFEHSRQVLRLCRRLQHLGS
jgi:hypothetical protein